MHATCTKLILIFLIIDQATNRAAGMASLFRTNPDSGLIEDDHINFAPLLQSTIGATEASYLQMRRAFVAGFRRYDWVCNALILRSRRVAQRLVLSYKGVL